MTSTDIDILVQQGEGATLEFKEALSPASFARELVALANTIGGKILLGVKALREAITNAVMHRDWFFEGANVFVELYADRIEVISPGGLPKGLTPDDLGRRSIRRNPLIADLLHRIEFIEMAGTGIRRIRDEAREVHCPEPEFEVDSFVTVTFRPNPAVRATAGEVTDQVADQVTDQVTGAGRVTPQVAPQVTDQVAPQVTDQVADSDQVTPEVTDQVTEQVRLLRAMSGEMTRQELQDAVGLRHRIHFSKAYLLPALRGRLIEMTIPDKPRSSRQRYRLTPAGREYLKRVGEAR